MDLPEDYYQTYIPNLQSFSQEDIQSVAKSLLVESEMSIVVVSDREAVESDLRSFGDLKITVDFVIQTSSTNREDYLSFLKRELPQFF